MIDFYLMRWNKPPINMRWSYALRWINEAKEERQISYLRTQYGIFGNLNRNRWYNIYMGNDFIYKYPSHIRILKKDLRVIAKELRNE